MRFNPTKYEVPCCKDIIWSRYPGEYRKCECGQSAVDETEHYCRFIGNLPKGVGKLYDGEEEIDEG